MILCFEARSQVKTDESLISWQAWAVWISCIAGAIKLKKAWDSHMQEEEEILEACLPAVATLAGNWNPNLTPVIDLQKYKQNTWSC